MDEVQANYVKPLDKQKMREFVENMVNGGLEKLDPHSGFFNEEEYREFTKHSEGKFGGVGIRIRPDPSGQILVETPIVGTPAYNAGVMAGDLIVKVDGKATEHLSIKNVVEMIQGDPGTDDPSVLYWYQFVPGKDPQWIPHLLDDNSGIGNNFQVEDINGDGLVDIIVSNKKGVFVFEQVRK